MEKQKLPNTTAVLVLGILSILTCCCYGVIGLILGIIALFLAKSDLQAYKISPEKYDNYNNLKIGRILSFIGIALSVLMIILIIWLISVVGIENLQDEELARQRLEEYFAK